MQHALLLAAQLLHPLPQSMALRFLQAPSARLRCSLGDPTSKEAMLGTAAGDGAEHYCGQSCLRDSKGQVARLQSTGCELRQFEAARCSQQDTLLAVCLPSCWCTPVWPGAQSRARDTNRW